VPYKGSVVGDPAPARRRSARRDGLHRLVTTSTQCAPRPQFVAHHHRRHARVATCTT
jgi:hypothetical protein